LDRRLIVQFITHGNPPEWAAVADRVAYMKKLLNKFYSSGGQLAKL
jgi:hypothetical protein